MAPVISEGWPLYFEGAAKKMSVRLPAALRGRIAREKAALELDRLESVGLYLLGLRGEKPH